MRTTQYRVRCERGEHWRFSAAGCTVVDDLPSIGQRTGAALAGTLCGIVLFSAVLPPHSQVKSAVESVTVARVLADAMRALTGFATSHAVDIDRRALKGAAGGIRN